MEFSSPAHIFTPTLPLNALFDFNDDSSAPTVSLLIKNGLTKPVSSNSVNQTTTTTTTDLSVSVSDTIQKHYKESSPFSVESDHQRVVDSPLVHNSFTTLSSADASCPSSPLAVDLSSNNDSNRTVVTSVTTPVTQQIETTSPNSFVYIPQNHGQVNTTSTTTISPVNNNHMNTNSTLTPVNTPPMTTASTTTTTTTTIAPNTPHSPFTAIANQTIGHAYDTSSPITNSVDVHQAQQQQQQQQQQAQSYYFNTNPFNYYPPYTPTQSHTASSVSPPPPPSSLSTTPTAPMFMTTMQNHMHMDMNHMNYMNHMNMAQAQAHTTSINYGHNVSYATAAPTYTVGSVSTPSSSSSASSMGRKRRTSKKSAAGSGTGSGARGRGKGSGVGNGVGLGVKSAATKKRAARKPQPTFYSHLIKRESKIDPRSRRARARREGSPAYPDLPMPAGVEVKKCLSTDPTTNVISLYHPSHMNAEEREIQGRHIGPLDNRAGMYDLFLNRRPGTDPRIVLNNTAESGDGPSKNHLSFSSLPFTSASVEVPVETLVVLPTTMLEASMFSLGQSKNECSNQYSTTGGVVGRNVTRISSHLTVDYTDAAGQVHSFPAPRITTLLLSNGKHSLVHGYFSLGAKQQPGLLAALKEIKTWMLENHSGSKLSYSSLTGLYKEVVAKSLPTNLIPDTPALQLISPGGYVNTRTACDRPSRSCRRRGSGEPAFEDEPAPSLAIDTNNNKKNSDGLLPHQMYSPDNKPRKVPKMSPCLEPTTTNNNSSIISNNTGQSSPIVKQEVPVISM